MKGDTGDEGLERDTEGVVTLTLHCETVNIIQSI